jgi:hypothetical protein
VEIGKNWPNAAVPANRPAHTPRTINPDNRIVCSR